MAGGPLRLEPLQVGLERILTGPEYVRVPPAKHGTDEATAVAGAPHDLFDWNPVLGQPKNGSGRLFPAQITLVLNPLGGGENIGIDRRGADRATDLPHRFLHRLEE